MFIKNNNFYPKIKNVINNIIQFNTKLSLALQEQKIEYNFFIDNVNSIIKSLSDKDKIKIITKICEDSDFYINNELILFKIKNIILNEHKNIINELVLNNSDFFNKYMEINTLNLDSIFNKIKCKKHFNKMYNVDCNQFIKDIPNNAIDLIICDPPYLMLENRKNKTYLAELIEGFSNILSENGNVCVYSHVHDYAMLVSEFLKNNFILKCNIEYIIPTGNNTSRFFMPSKINILIFSFNKKSTFNNISISEYSNNDTIKPINLNKNYKLTNYLIKSLSNVNDIVYIPFSSTGNEILSCSDLKREWIATEEDINYINAMDIKIKELFC
jgi:hypothetical protein